MTADRTDQIEARIGQWRDYLRRGRAIAGTDIDELEGHLRDQMEDLEGAGLTADEAFLVAVTRLGNLDEISREFAREHTERLWKQLALTPTPGPPHARGGRDLAVALACASAAAIAIQLPRLAGLDPVNDGAFYLRNVGLLVLPFLAGYFAWKRRLGAATRRLLVLWFAVGAIAANVYPFATSGSTEVLTAIHLPVALWFGVGLAYAGGDWRSDQRRMDAVRFTGEWVVYYALIALGGGVLVALTAAAFATIGLDLDAFTTTWLVPSGVAGAVVVAAWLVEAKQSVVENMAPVLTKVFTPLFTLMLLAFLGAVVWTRAGIDIERDLLIIFDLLLVLVLGLLLYAISARDPLAPPDAFDRLQLLLVVSALAVDVLVLAAMVGRISTFGVSPNKVAALGLNLILLVNLARAAHLAVGFLRRRRPFASVEHWQMRYLPVLAAWAWIVVVAFPPVFAFV